MNIYPINTAEANRRHWVVRLLRYFGYLDAIAGIVAGVILGNNFGAFLLIQATGLSFDVANAIGMILGGLLGFCAGILIGLPLWGMALIADDLHALRVYASGYAMVGDDHPRQL